jgi:predicted Zn-dependent protease
MFRGGLTFFLLLFALTAFYPLMAHAKSDGEEAYDEIISSGSAYPDQRIQDYVNRIGQELARNSDKPKQKFTFTVIDSENINAFAMPGGYVFVNRGLMLYLDNEAELAGVIGHEIGHVTENHAGRQKAAAVGNQVASQLAYILTGSADFADGTNMAGTAMVRGYGRDHELEADAAGAAFMYSSGYDPYALLDVIGVLKDQEQYNRVKAKQSGKKAQTYHGLFSTHPRNDARLQQVIKTAGELDPEATVGADIAEFRSIINGMTYGKRATITERDEDRYYHNKLKFTFVEPGGWSVKAGSRAIVAAADDASATVSLTIKRKDENLTARSFIGEQLEASKLVNAKPLELSGLEGYSAVSPADGSHNSRRLAVIYKGRIAYLFEGEVRDEADFPIKDAYFNALIESFRSMKKSEAASKDAQQMAYIQAQPGMTWAALAKSVPIRDAENQLRLLNGQYPRGEPRAGDWIKIIR